MTALFSKKNPKAYDTSRYRFKFGTSESMQRHIDFLKSHHEYTEERLIKAFPEYLNSFEERERIMKKRRKLYGQNA